MHKLKHFTVSVVVGVTTMYSNPNWYVVEQNFGQAF